MRRLRFAVLLVLAGFLAVLIFAALEPGRRELALVPPKALRILYYRDTTGMLYSFSGKRGSIPLANMKRGEQLKQLIGVIAPGKVALAATVGKQSPALPFIFTIGAPMTRSARVPLSPEWLDNTTVFGGAFVAALARNGVIEMITIPEEGRQSLLSTVSIPNRRVGCVIGPPSISRDGVAAICVSTREDQAPVICLVNVHGGEPRIIGFGYSPAVSQDSTKVAYVEAEPQGGLTRSCEIAVFDVDSHRTRTIKAWRPTHLTQLCPLWPGRPQGPVSVQWASGSRWLICDLMLYQHFDHILTAVDTESDQCQRYELPIRVEPRRWLSCSMPPDNSHPER